MFPGLGEPGDRAEPGSLAIMDQGVVRPWVKPAPPTALCLKVTTRPQIRYVASCQHYQRGPGFSPHSCPWKAGEDGLRCEHSLALQSRLHDQAAAKSSAIRLLPSMGSL